MHEQDNNRTQEMIKTQIAELEEKKDF
jgi:hypothetical protein